jgi:hypothetical protein
MTHGTTILSCIFEGRKGVVRGARADEVAIGSYRVHRGRIVGGDPPGEA